MRSRAWFAQGAIALALKRAWSQTRNVRRIFGDINKVVLCNQDQSIMERSISKGFPYFKTKNPDKRRAWDF
jgi:hypothetical protein